ncbi:MAG: type I restriction enzyme HsdR N-terminal domain-containing protein [Saprospiraceae bacterium]
MIDIDLHKYSPQLKIQKNSDGVFIFDIIRKKYLVLQPEEMVRQLMIHYLIDYGYPIEKIQVEKGLHVNGMYRRYDIVIYNAQFEPLILIECKSHKVKIQQAVFDQIAQYNSVMKAPYLIVTNGVQTYCCALDFEKKGIEYLTSIPEPK